MKMKMKIKIEMENKYEYGALLSLHHCWHLAKDVMNGYDGGYDGYE